MSYTTFTSLFESKRFILGHKLRVDGDLLDKLQDYKIITENQASRIEVTFVTICKF